MISKSLFVVFLFDFITIYKAGACFPLLLPCGCLEHELLVNDEIDDEEEPQNLQEYFGFSLPS